MAVYSGGRCLCIHSIYYFNDNKRKKQNLDKSLMLEFIINHAFHLKYWQSFSKKKESRDTPLERLLSSFRCLGVKRLTGAWWVSVERGLVCYPLWTHYCAVVVPSIRLAVIDLAFLKTCFTWSLKAVAYVWTGCAGGPSPPGRHSPCSSLPLFPLPSPLLPSSLHF